MKKIVSILGARPQFVKAAVLSRIIREKQEFSEVIIHTGQHFDANMSEVFFKEMEIPKPKYNFDINGVTHGAMTGRMLEKIEEVLLIEKPALVLVYGDTKSSILGNLFYVQFKSRYQFYAGQNEVVGFCIYPCDV